MREDLLHFIWKYKKLQLIDVVSSDNEKIKIFDVGQHNHLSGPDFFNAKIEINEQLWAGNVEIHLNSSDWYVHNHEQDDNYDNVILHVVWQDDAAIFRKNGAKIPTLELKNYISKSLLNAYQNLFDQSHRSFINCENNISEVDDFIIDNWKERLFFERLESKSDFIYQMLKESNNDWEQVLFKMLLKSFGLKINGLAFLSLANAIEFSIIRKLCSTEYALESVFFGMSNLLEENSIVDEYYIKLKNEYQYQKVKFELQNEAVIKPDFFKLRPANFPTIRLSQFANLYTANQTLFSSLIQVTKLDEVYKIFDVAASDYWSTHFTFGKTSKKSNKKLTKNFIHLLVVNTILPLKFSFAKYSGVEATDAIVSIISQIKREQNSIVSSFDSLKIKLKTAKDSQAILQLYNEYCTKNKCLQCAIGANLLKRND